MRIFDELNFEKLKGQALKWIISFLQALFIICILFLLFWPIIIEGNSMEDSFHTKDILFFSRTMVYLDMIKNKDVIICKIEENGKQVEILKRVTGIPGDKIKIVDGIVFVNDVILEEDYIKNKDEYGYNEIVLKDNEYFILGDNRRTSFDSRNIGAIEKKQIVGKVIFKFYPFNKMKFY